MACHYYLPCVCLIFIEKIKEKYHRLFNFPFCKLLFLQLSRSAFSTLHIFHTPHFQHSAFSTLRIFYTLHFPHSAFSTLRIFHTPRSALRTPHFPLNPKVYFINLNTGLGIFSEYLNHSELSLALNETFCFVPHLCTYNFVLIVAVIQFVSCDVM